MSVGNALAWSGDIEGANGAFRQGLEEVERAASDPLLVVRTSSEPSARIEQRRGNWKSAEDPLRAALAGYAKAGGTNHPEYARALIRVATLEVDTGRLGDGEKDAKRAHSVLETAKGDANDLSDAWMIQAEARLARGDREAARAAFAHARDTLSRDEETSTAPPMLIAKMSTPPRWSSALGHGSS